MPGSVAIDAMGGDYAPAEVVRGTVRAALEFPDVEFLLVGPEEPIAREIEAVGGAPGALRVVHAPEVIGMGESPVEALRRKRRSSIVVALELVRAGEAKAFLSAGNTGACVAAAQMLLRPLPAVRRPGILVTMRAGERPICVCDVGANVQPRPEHLAQYAVMASLYAEHVVGVERPRAGLLNVGEEEGKGNELVKVARPLLESAPIEFVGYVEGDDLFGGSCDVVICDGFAGNVLLKVSEGLAERLASLFREVVSGVAAEFPVGHPCSGELDTLFGRAMGELRERLDYSEYGGAPLLGVDGTVIIAHGRSDARAIFNAARVAIRMLDVDINSRIRARLEA